jgi:hypothetical protein
MALPSLSYFIDSNQTGDEIDFHFIFSRTALREISEKRGAAVEACDLHPGAKGPAT